MVESFPKQFFMMFKLPLILACAIFSAHMACAAAADKYSVIPEPEKTELQHNSTRTLKLLSDQEAPTLGTPTGSRSPRRGRTLLPEEGKAEFTGWQPSASSGTSWRDSRRASPAASSRTSRAIRGAASW